MPAGATYEPIATTTLGSAQSSITFSSISSSYTDLRVTLFTNTNSASNEFFYLEFNGDTATNYSTTKLWGNGTSALSARVSSASNIEAGRSSGVSNIWSFTKMDIFGYAGSTNKTVLCESSCDLNGSGSVWRNVGLWRSTSAINQVKLLAAGGVNFNSGTVATLYGIKAA